PDARRVRGLVGADDRGALHLVAVGAGPARTPGPRRRGHAPPAGLDVRPAAPGARPPGRLPLLRLHAARGPVVGRRHQPASPPGLARLRPARLPRPPTDPTDTPAGRGARLDRRRPGVL